MSKRMIIMLVAMTAFVMAIGSVKFRQIQAGAAQAASFQPPPEAVTTTVARQEEWSASLSAIGSVAPVQGVTVSADLPGIVIRADYRETAEVGVDFFRGKEIRDRAVLVHTGWDQFWDTDQYFEGHPFLTAEAAVYLKENGARLVGIDSLNIDDIRGKSRPVHSSLLRENILIVEHLCNLDQIPDDGFTFSAIPPKFKGVGTFPIRALARIT
jgi:hypothetical protein